MKNSMNELLTTKNPNSNRRGQPGLKQSYLKAVEMTKKESA